MDKCRTQSVSPHTYQCRLLKAAVCQSRFVRQVVEEAAKCWAGHYGMAEWPSGSQTFRVDDFMTSCITS